VCITSLAEYRGLHNVPESGACVCSGGGPTDCTGRCGDQILCRFDLQRLYGRAICYNLNVPSETHVET
jgi:hypothetical protein